MQDCDCALAVSEGNRRALYRKALCLRELGRFREAYECGTGCLLASPHVRYLAYVDMKVFVLIQMSSFQLQMSYLYARKADTVENLHLHAQCM